MREEPDPLRLSLAGHLALPSALRHRMLCRVGCQAAVSHKGLRLFATGWDEQLKAEQLSEEEMDNDTISRTD